MVARTIDFNIGPDMVLSSNPDLVTTVVLGGNAGHLHQYRTAWPMDPFLPHCNAARWHGYLAQLTSGFCQGRPLSLILFVTQNRNLIQMPVSSTAGYMGWMVVGHKGLLPLLPGLQAGANIRSVASR